ncbi:MAG: winged helix-turn-helix domain-containing protein [Candidatus Binatia bacterium]
MPLRPKAFAVLRYLAERHGQLGTKDEIVAHVWDGAAIASGGLKVLIGELPEALGDEPTAPRFIETVARRGYRFIAPVTRALGASPFPAGATHFAAWAMVDRGEVDAGIARMRAGLEGWRATGAGLGLPSHLGRLTEAYLAAGDPNAAAAPLDEALAFNERSDQRYYEAELHRLRGVLLLQHPERAATPTDADDALTRALALATAQGSAWLACRAATTLAGLRRDQGRAAEARHILNPIVAALDANDTSRDAAAARALHAALPLPTK